MEHHPTAIVGGGIAGLAAALALGNRASLILEQAIQFEDVGAGLQIGPNAVQALQRLGAWEAVVPHTSSPPEIHMRDGLSGRLLKRIPLGKTFEGRFGAPYRVAHRADLHAALLDVVKSQSNVMLQTAAKLEDMTTHGDRIELLLADGKSLTADAAIGADGVKSTVRQLVFGSSEAQQSGETLHRGLLAGVPSSPNIAFDCVNLWFYPGGHVVHYPVGWPQRLNVVAVTPVGRNPVTYFSRACTPLREVLNEMPAWLPWPGLYAPFLTTWHKGNTLLVGDAAHATLPYLAQGAAMALEDAAELKTALVQQKRLPEIFETWQRRRKHRTSALHAQTLANGKIYHANGMQRLVQNTALRMAPASIIRRQMDWIWSWPNPQ